MTDHDLAEIAIAIAIADAIAMVTIVACGMILLNRVFEFMGKINTMFGGATRHLLSLQTKPPEDV